jgi:hypothetical protein
MIKDIVLTSDDDWSCDRCGEEVIEEGLGWEYSDEDIEGTLSFSLCSKCIRQIYLLARIEPIEPCGLFKCPPRK